MKHTLGFIYFVALCGSTETCEVAGKDAIYDKVSSLLDRSLSRNTLIALDDFRTTIGTNIIGYELCAGAHGSGSRNENGSRLVNLAQFRMWRIGGFCITYHNCTAGLGLAVLEGQHGRFSLEDPPELHGFPEH